MRLLRGLGVLAVLVASLAGCAGDRIWASDEEVAKARYVHPGPPELVLYTSMSDRAGSGEHTALMINASQRVLFDPAGNWVYPYAPERHDVRFGFDPRAERNYLAFQAQPNFHAAIQRVLVSPEVAELALNLVMANGSVAPAMCTSATAAILRQLPGFESLPSTMFPVTLKDAFGQLPGVETTIDYGAPPTDPNVPRLGPHAVTG